MCLVRYKYVYGKILFFYNIQIQIRFTNEMSISNYALYFKIKPLNSIFLYNFCINKYLYKPTACRLVNSCTVIQFACAKQNQRATKSKNQGMTAKSCKFKFRGLILKTASSQSYTS